MLRPPTTMWSGMVAVTESGDTAHDGVMTALHEVAEEIGAHERTLRRGLSDGLVRGRPTAGTVELADGEVTYLRAHWPLLSALRGALRSQRNVRLGVLIGSVARGTMHKSSDVDVLVEFADANWRVQDRLRERLARASGRPANLVAVEAALDDPLLLDAALRDGRVLVDREGRWPSLLARRAQTARAAARAAEELRDELHALVAEISAED
jgi:predicted nucleotidyltransferase